MATRQARKKSKKKGSVKPKKKIAPQRTLAKALTDLNKLFTRKELSRKFKVKPNKVSLYKHYKKGREKLKSQDKILRFYRKLQSNKHNEKLKYFYRTVGQDRRIEPSRNIPAAKISDLIEKLGYDKKTKKVIWSRGIKRTAKQLGVSVGTVRRWSKGRTGRIKKKKREKLGRVIRKKLRALYGIFFLAEDFLPKGKRRNIEYHRMLYYRNFHGNKTSFRAFVGEQTIYGIEKSLIAERGKFSKREANDFLDYLKEIRMEYRRTNNERLIAESVESCIQFVNDNFKGGERLRMIRKIRKYGHITVSDK